ncbi:MAG: glycosyltransferase family 39 protein, partial [Candidatus Hydrogenedentota bacterium]
MTASRRDSLLGILSVLGLYLATIAIVHPFGDFPLNDDWAFASMVKTYVETGIVRFSSWPKMTFLAQLFYGALFARLFDFSHVILRISTMVLGGSALMLFFVMLRFAGITVSRAVLGSVVLSSNPFFLGSCFTFMTDIPYLFAVFAAVLLYAWSCEHDNWWMLLLAGATAGIAGLVRQTGILLPVAAAAVMVWNKGEWKSRLVKLGVFGFFPAASLAGFEIWMRYIHGLPPETWRAHYLHYFAGPALLIQNIVEVPAVAICYLGLLLLPITLPFGIAWLRTYRTRSTSLAGIFALLALAGFSIVRAAKGEWMPYQGNMWFDQKTFGQGPYNLKDVSILVQTDAVACPDWIFYATTVLSVILGALVVSLFWLGWSRMRRAPTVVKFSLAAALLHPGFFVFINFYFDRHLLPVFPFVILVLLFNLRELRPRPAWICVCVLVLYAVTVAGVYHYHRWNEARWTAIGYLTKEVGASVSEIDGGFEYNGWMFFEDYFPPPEGEKSWWWVWDDKYIISFSKIT